MTKLASLIGLVVVALAATGCAYAKAPVTGFIYLSTQSGENISSNDVGAKRG